MAQSFTALGKGNGFPFCLTEVDVPDDAILSNAPTLEQTMNAYWNFKSATFGGATFEPGNEPKDLICDETLNIGSGANGSFFGGGEFSVSNNLPSIFFIGGNKYYRHGISMSFAVDRITYNNNGIQSSSTSVDYFSSYYVEGSDSHTYNCVDLFFGEPPEQELIGRRASERIRNFSNVTISGIPFIKKVSKLFFGEVAASGGEDEIGPVPGCPSPSYSEPGTPTLNLHTY